MTGDGGTRWGNPPYGGTRPQRGLTERWGRPPYGGTRPQRGLSRAIEGLLRGYRGAIELFVIPV